MISITFDEKLDKEVYLDFVDLTVAGADFGRKIRRDHPEISPENHERYIEEYYERHSADLQLARTALEKAIERTRDQFFTSVSAIFRQDYSDIESIGALSIFDCNPRWAEKNLLQVYFRRDDVGKMGVVYHETLHLIFFRYCAEHFSTMVENKSLNRGTYWELSELFNVIILNQPEFQGILGRKEFLFYPDLGDKLKRVSGLWGQTAGDIEKFIPRAFAELEPNA